MGPPPARAISHDLSLQGGGGALGALSPAVEIRVWIFRRCAEGRAYAGRTGPPPHSGKQGALGVAKGRAGYPLSDNRRAYSASTDTQRTKIHNAAQNPGPRSHEGRQGKAPRGADHGATGNGTGAQARPTDGIIRGTQDTNRATCCGYPSRLAGNRGKFSVFHFRRT